MGDKASGLAPNLAKVLTGDSSAGVRVAAAQALGAVGAKSGVAHSALKAALETEPDAGVRQALSGAITSLESRGPARDLPEGGVRDDRSLSGGQASTGSGTARPGADGGQGQSPSTPRIEVRTGGGTAHRPTDAELGAGRTRSSSTWAWLGQWRYHAPAVHDRDHHRMDRATRR